jgi:hypothetical protein
MAKSKDVVVNISLDSEEFDRELEKMEARTLRLLVMQLTARMDDVERGVIELREVAAEHTVQIDQLDEVLDEGLKGIEEAVKAISLKSYDADGTIESDPENDPYGRSAGAPQEEWTEVRKIEEKPKRRGLRAWWPR